MVIVSTVINSDLIVTSTINKLHIDIIIPAKKQWVWKYKAQHPFQSSFPNCIDFETTIENIILEVEDLYSRHSDIERI